MAGTATTKVVLSAVAGNGVITVAKGFGWLTTGSPSMLAEAIHSLADTFNQALLYIGIRHGDIGPSRSFPLGQAGARYLWNLISATGIFFIGFGVTLYHGIHALLHAHEVTELGFNWIAIGILLFALVVEGYVLLIALKGVNAQRGETGLIEFLKHSDDPTAVAVLFEDAIAVLGVVLALVGIVISNALHTALPDAIASILIGMLLGVMAVVLAVVNGRLLLGRAADHELEDEIRELIASQLSVESVEHLTTRVVGPSMLRLSCEIELHGSALIDREQFELEVEELRAGNDPAPILADASKRMVRLVGAEINALERVIRERYPQVVVIDLEVH
jgi:zinc transporter 9